MNILIVDDEELIRERLSGLEEWGRLGCKVVGEAANGKEALQLAESCKPDLIITDIRMPVMDGIELAQSIRALHPCTKIIFISAYSDFAYAKQALKLGVTDFITKPIEVKELIGAVEGMLQSYDRFERNGELIQEQLIQLLLSSNPEAMNPDLQAQLLPVGKRPAILLSVEFDSPGIDVDETHPILLLTLKQSVCNTIKDYPYPFWSCVKPEGFSLILFQVEEQNVDLRSGSMQIAREISKSCSRAKLPSVSIAISQVLPSVLRLREGWEHIQRCRDYKMLLGKGSIIASDSLGDVDGSEDHEREELHLTELKGYLRKGEKDQVPLNLRAAYRQMLIKGYRKIEVQRYVLGLLEFTEQLRTEFSLPSNDGDAIEIRKKILSCDTLSELMKFMEQHLTAVAGQVAAFQQSAGSRLFKDIMHYMEKHYREEISLGVLASHLHLNPSYLSRQIKKETGVNFRDLLWNFRIEKAKEILLVEQNMKSFKVAYEVGFKDPSHFSFLFKRLVGVTPTEFREFSLFSREQVNFSIEK